MKKFRKFQLSSFFRQENLMKKLSDRNQSITDNQLESHQYACAKYDLFNICFPEQRKK